MEIKLAVVERGSEEYRIQGNHLSQIIYVDRKVPLELLRQMLRLIDDGFTIQSQFSLEAFLQDVIENVKTDMEKDVILGLVESSKSGGRGTRSIKWSNYDFIPPQEYTPDAIRKVREKCKLSQSTLAKILGVSKNTVVWWEVGRTKPGGSSIRILDMLLRDPYLPLKYGLINKKPPKAPPKKKTEREKKTPLYERRMRSLSGGRIRTFCAFKRGENVFWVDRTEVRDKYVADTASVYRIKNGKLVFDHEESVASIRAEGVR